LFLWIGDESRPDHRAALAIQWATIVPPNVAVDHVQVRQSSEPPIFSAICFHHFHCPVCVLDALSSTALPLTTVFDCYMPRLGLDGLCPSLVQIYPQLDNPIPIEALPELSPSRCRLVIKISPVSKGQVMTVAAKSSIGRASAPLLAQAVDRVNERVESLVRIALNSSGDPLPSEVTIRVEKVRLEH
jgi:hypothetical protein